MQYGHWVGDQLLGLRRQGAVGEHAFAEGGEGVVSLRRELPALLGDLARRGREHAVLHASPLFSLLPNLGSAHLFDKR
jgi:hypothetical protein